MGLTNHDKVTESEHFQRGNFITRSLRKLRSKQPSDDKKEHSKKEDETSPKSSDKETEDRILPLPVPKRPLSGAKERYRSSSESEILIAQRRKTNKDKDKMRPFSQLFAGSRKSKEVVPAVTKPDNFMNVKLKPTEKKAPVKPQTTERYKLFEGVYQISLIVTESGEMRPKVSWSHPPLGTTEDRNLRETGKTVPDFAFPDLDILEKKSKQIMTETYAFVLTNMTCTRTIGYCRRFKYKEIYKIKDRAPSNPASNIVEKNPGTPVKLTKKQKKLLKIRVWCIVTQLHCFDTFSSIFDEVHQIRRKIEESNLNADSEVFAFLKAIGATPAPIPGHTIQVKYITQLAENNEMAQVNVKRPGPEDRIHLLKLADLPNQLGVKMVINIMIALLSESKVLFLAKKLPTLTTCLHALTSLLYPLQWECIYIPMLSVGIRGLIRDLVQSPTPYVIGMLKEDYAKVREYELKDTQVLVVDLTTRNITDLRYETQKPLPISNEMRKSLKADMKIVKKKKDYVRKSQIWQDFIQKFMEPLDDLCKSADLITNARGVREIRISDYMNVIQSNLPGNEEFGKLFAQTQMVQQYLQKKTVRVSPD